MTRPIPSSFLAAAMALLSLLPETSSAQVYPLTLEQRERLKRYIPRTFIKLEARDPVHVVLLGDSVMGGHTPLASAWEKGNPLFTYPGTFLTLLAKEFFYPGGVRLINPPVGGSGKLVEFLGDEITFENLAGGSATAFDGLRHSLSDAFVNEPDLVLIQYGVYDGIEHVPLEAYRRALQESVAAAKTALADVVVLGPTAVRQGGGAMDWGTARPCAMVAKEVADDNEVMFVDLGKLLAEWPGGTLPDTHPLASMEIIGDRMGKIFDFGPKLRRPENIHPGKRAHDYLGQAIFDEFNYGPRFSDFTFGGAAVFGKEGEVRVAVSVRNQTKENKKGTLGALAVGDCLVPRDPAQRFEVAPGESVRMEFAYHREAVGETRDGAPLHHPLETDAGKVHFPFVVEDMFRAEFVNLPLRVEPVSLSWKSLGLADVTDQVGLKWELVNGSDQAVSGTYQIGMGRAVSDATPFSLSPLGTRTFGANFDFDPPAGVDQFQEDLWIEVEVDGRRIRFDREMEATRDLALGETMALRSWSDYIAAPPAGSGAATRRPVGRASARFEADGDGLLLVADMVGITIPDLGTEAALLCELALDARPVGEARSFGAVKPLKIYTRGGDGPGLVKNLEIGSFGNGYDMVLDPRGVQSVLKTEEGVRRLEVRIPRSYFHRHEWTVDEGFSLLGFKLDLVAADPNGGKSESQRFPDRNRFTTHSPTIYHEGNLIRGFHPSDARGLTTLRLNHQPASSWSVRVY